MLPPLDLGLRGRVRVLLGPQDDHFTPVALRTLLESVYTVSQASDRMGMRLEGPLSSTRARATTSSPTASRMAPSRCPAMACPSSCWRTGRPLAAIPRSRPSSPPTFPRWAA